MADAGATQRDSRVRHPLLRVAYDIATVLLIWLGLVAVLLLEFQPLTRVEVGTVSSRDIRTRERFSYVSDLRTAREQEREAEQVAPTFSPPDRSLAVRQAETLTAMADYMTAVRGDTLGGVEQQTAYIQAIQPVHFSDEATTRLLALDAEEWTRVVSETRRVVDSTMRDEITEGQLAAVLATVPNQISTTLNDDELVVVREWAGGLITPNSFLDVERTESARTAARQQVPPVQVTLEAGQIIVREGDVITAEQVEALNAAGLHLPTREPTERISMAALLLLLVLLLAFYLRRFQPERWDSPRAMGFIALVFIALSLGARLVMVDHLLLSYLFPTAAGAMILCVLLGPDIALLITVLFSLIIGLLTGSLELLTYTFVGGTLSTLMLWKVERLGTFVKAGLALGVALVSVVVIFALREGAPLTSVRLAATAGMAMLNGVASASAALAGFYALGGLLGTTTFLQLMELSRPTHPLFRELLLKAPGTYHHVIVVSNLAERAAEAVGADMLLVRVAAYYHDVGKVTNPHFFIENQAEGMNPHAVLDDPYQSAAIILAHVTDGVKLAQKHGLPRTIINGIQQHHGTTRVEYFYRKACQRDGDANVNAALFQYPGPKPQSRETGILMLADTVEAAARATKPTTMQELTELTGRLIIEKLEEGQLDECDLTLRDLTEIRTAFIGVLQGIYHPRIPYPERAPALATPTPSTHDPTRSPDPDKPIAAVGQSR